MKSHVVKYGRRLTPKKTVPYQIRLLRTSKNLQKQSNQSLMEDLPLDEDILSQVFGKDKRGRTRSIGAKISRTQVKAFNIARKQLKKAQGGSEDLKARMDNIEGTLKSFVDLLKGQYAGQ